MTETTQTFAALRGDGESSLSPALSTEEVRAGIWAGAGSQFCPVCAAALLAVLRSR